MTAQPGVDSADRIRRQHAALHGPHRLEDCTDPLCRETAAVLRAADPLAAHGCLHSAIVTDGDRQVIYPCRSHDDGTHHYAAHWPACAAPWCRLEPGHAEMHDIPAGHVEYHDAIGAKNRG